VLKRLPSPVAVLSFLAALFLPLTGCVGTPVIKMPVPVPDIVREHKSFKLDGSKTEWLDSGVRVAAGDYFTLLAKGEMSGGSGMYAGRQGPAGNVLFRIGLEGKVNSFGYYMKWNNLRVGGSGNIYLRLSKNLQGLWGSFPVDIIVWKSEDPVRIAQFLEELSLKDPDNRTLKQLLQVFRDKQELFLAEQKAKQEVEETRRAIASLEAEPSGEEAGKGVSKASPGGLPETGKPASGRAMDKGIHGTGQGEKEKQIAELTKKLEQATLALNEFEDLKRREEELGKKGLTPPARDIPRVAVWQLEPRETKPSQARELTSILVSEVVKLRKCEVYSQEHVQVLAGWSAERMKLGCTDSKCLTALGQMDIAKLIWGSVGKIGSRYSISLSLFDTEKAKADHALSEFCNSEDELIELLQKAVPKLLEGWK